MMIKVTTLPKRPIAMVEKLLQRGLFLMPEKPTHLLLTQQIAQIQYLILAIKVLYPQQASITSVAT
ncbi:hypothetical protein D3C73_761710 [compost metagenome]